MTNFTGTSIAQLRSEIVSGKTNASDIVEEVILRADAQKELNALQYMNADQARKAAKQAKAKQAKIGVLSGIPFIAKDNINTNNMPSSAGTTALKTHIPKNNAPAIDRLLEAGAILVGKAGMHELAFGVTSNNSAMGAIKNPHDLTLIPGGSSGGTAAAVAACIVPFGLGTDTGGSCRIPAALCGVVGFRPTTGRYPAQGIVPISHTRDTIGPIARTTEDIITIDSVLAGMENSISAKSANAITLGIDQSVLCQNLEAEVQAAFDKAIAKLKEAGVEIKAIDLSQIWDHNVAFSFPVVLYEVMRDLPAYLEKYAPNISFETLVANIQSPDVLGVIQGQLGEEAIPEETYRAALDTHQPKMREIYKAVFEKNGLDAIIFPTTPLRAAKIGEDETLMLNGENVPTFPTYIRNTDLGSNLGVPGLSIPAASEGMPVGIEIDGVQGGDATLFSVALTIENIISK